MMKMNGLLARMTGWLALACLPLQANAAYFCAGPIELVAVERSGRIGFRAPSWAQNSISILWVCSVSTVDASGIPPDSCKAILSTLLSAKVTGATVVWAFNDSLSCTTHPTDTTLTGWYSVDTR